MDSHMQKDDVSTVLHTKYKNELKMDQKPKS